MSSEKKTHVKTYLLFDRTTGTILGTHSMYDAETRSYSERPLEEVRAVFGDLIQGATGEQYEILAEDLPRGRTLGGHYVDVKSRKLVPKLQLQVKPQRAQLQGDGKDTVEVQITVVDDHGKAHKSFSGELQVITTRGKLSTPGGRIKAHNGQGSIRLTSVVETVNKVSITVRDPTRCCALGVTTVEFV